jgi:hypothetical protein
MSSRAKDRAKAFSRVYGSEKAYPIIPANQEQPTMPEGEFPLECPACTSCQLEHFMSVKAADRSYATYGCGGEYRLSTKQLGAVWEGSCGKE